MRPDESAFDHLAALMPDAPPETVRTRLGAFGFGQEKALFPVGELSGGERARLNLALVTHDAPSLLILDEPTNHLDMETREALVAALAEYSGAVVLVSHDWHLVELVADRLWLVEGGTVRPFDDDLDAYRRRLLSREEAAPERTERGNGASGPGDPRRTARRDAAERRVALEPLRRKSRQAEQTAARLAAEQRALDTQAGGARRFRRSRPGPRRGAEAARRTRPPDRRSRGGMDRGRERNRADDAGMTAVRDDSPRIASPANLRRSRRGQQPQRQPPAPFDTGPAAVYARLTTERCCPVLRRAYAPHCLSPPTNRPRPWQRHPQSATAISRRRRTFR